MGEDQKARWNGDAGNAWVDGLAVIDAMFRPLEELLAGAVSVPSGGRILDVGCGTGGTTVALARDLGAEAVGVDISEGMVEAATARAGREGARASFLVADAQDHPFEPGSFDAVVSRFGVMFFDDPVQAFANLRRAARDGAGLSLVVWRSPEENPFMTAAVHAALPFLPDLPLPDSGKPGQFGFADRDRVAGILADGGWSGIEITPVDVPCVLPERELDGYYTRFGHVGLALPGTDERTREKVVEAVRAAFEPFVEGAEVRYTAACWLVEARA
ncbi:class I SAM-dependent methyltransferase [Actinocorallia longicatena]